MPVPYLDTRTGRIPWFHSHRAALDGVALLLDSTTTSPPALAWLTDWPSASSRVQVSSRSRVRRAASSVRG